MISRDRVLTIIVTYNAELWINKCFNSIKASTIDAKILVLDNGSTDNTLEILKNDFPDVEIIETGKNLGFGKANNIGLKRVLEDNYDYAFLLNQDAWIGPNTIEQLIAIHQSNKEFGILAPLQLNGDGSLIDNLFYQYSVTPCRALVTDTLLENSAVLNLYETSFLNAACWLLPKRTLEILGGFDPLFPHYGEDDDYINRAKFQGLKIGLCPKCIVYHDRETRRSNMSYEKQLNYAYIRLLAESKSNLTPKQSKSYYYKKIVLNLINSLFGNNKSYYKIQIEATNILLKNYRSIELHRKNEMIKSAHYLT